jgi:hypothetical protein
MLARTYVCILLCFILVAALAPPPTMKKVRIDIAPNLGVKDREVHVDIRFDADNQIRAEVSEDSLVECVNYNCVQAKERLKEEGFTSAWRANKVILDRITDYYMGRK